MRALRVLLACGLGIFALPWSALSAPAPHHQCCQHVVQPCACQTHCGCVQAPDPAPTPSETQAFYAPVVATIEFPILDLPNPVVVAEPIETEPTPWVSTTGPRAPPGRAPPF